MDLVLAIETRSLEIGEGASPADRAAIIAAIESTDGVERIIHLRTRHPGPDEILVGAKVHFDEAYDTEDLAAAINRVESTVRSEVPTARPMYIEPGIYRAGS